MYAVVPVLVTVTVQVTVAPGVGLAVSAVLLMASAWSVTVDRQRPSVLDGAQLVPEVGEETVVGQDAVPAPVRTSSPSR